jgi:hypothetical protein
MGFDDDSDLCKEVLSPFFEGMVEWALRMLFACATVPLKGTDRRFIFT